MRKGEKGILLVIAGLAVVLMGNRLWQVSGETEKDPGIPFYSTASTQLLRSGSDLYRQLNCKSCHSLWSIRDMTANVPAPVLDGIGSLRGEEWFYTYFSAENPQSILPSRLKQVYRMPSYAGLTDAERKILAAYMASLKVKDWYLEETKKSEYEKLTGKPYKAASAQ